MSKLYGMSIISQKNIADENFKLKSSIVKIFVNILHLIYAFILNNCVNYSKLKKEIKHLYHRTLSFLTPLEIENSP